VNSGKLLLGNFAPFLALSHCHHPHNKNIQHYTLVMKNSELSMTQQYHRDESE